MQKTNSTETNLISQINKLVSFALPISASSLINMVANFLSMLMVSHLGEKTLAAGALAIPTFITITMVLPIFYAVGILISHTRGQGRSAIEVGIIVKNGFWLAVLFFIPTALLLWNVNYLLIALGQNKELVNITKPYFHYAAFAILPMLIGTVINQFYSGIGIPRFSLIISLINLPCTLIFSYALILGKWGFPQLGLAGITLAAIIVQTSLCILVLIYLYFEKNLKQYQLFTRPFLPEMTVLKKIFNLGLPIGIQFGGELAAMTTATYMMGYFGVEALAASQVVAQYSMLVVMVILGFSQAVSILVSEAYGKGNYSLIKQYIHAAILSLTAIFIIITTLFAGFSKILISVFIDIHNHNNQLIIHYATIFFLISIVVLYIDGIGLYYTAALRGLHDSKTPMRIGIICLWLISLPVSYTTAFLMKLGPIGLRVGYISGFVIKALLLKLRFRKKYAN